jgi:hypothetical protein
VAIYSTSSINYSYLKVRWQEPYVSSALNAKTFGVTPKGVYSGFVIGPGGLSTRDIQITSGSVSGGLGTGMTGGYVSGNFDESVGFSIAVHQNTSGWQTTLSFPPGSMPFHLDATGMDGNRVYIVIDVNYNVNQNTAANFLLVDGSQIDQNPTYIVLGYCDVPSNPAQALSGSNFGYQDPTYPRLTPLASSQKAGFMSASAYNLLTQNFLWQQLLASNRDPNNNYQITIAPSQAVNSGTNARIYTYLRSNLTSMFPRSATGAYNGGAANNQLTYLNIKTGTISGAHQLTGNLSFSVPSVSGTPSSYQMGVVGINSSDQISVTYGSVYSSFAQAALDANLPSVANNVMQICSFVVSTDATGVILPLAVNALSDRRGFFASNASAWVQEVPSGVVNGTNTAFSLSGVPSDLASLDLYLDGLMLRQGVDYTISNASLTLNSAPVIGQDLWAKYWK